MSDWQGGGGQSPPGAPPPQGGSIFLTTAQNIVTAINGLTTAFMNIWPRVTGTFTMPAAASFAVAQPATKATSVVMLSPTNQAAATLMGGVNSLFVSSITPGVGFTVAGVGAGAGGGTFSYAIFNPS